MKKSLIVIAFLIPPLLCADGDQSWYFSSYLHTCDNCTVENDVLRCNCSIRDTNIQRPTALYRMSQCPLDISNCNGKLTCGRCQ